MEKTGFRIKCGMTIEDIFMQESIIGHKEVEIALLKKLLTLL
jgi:hypothetical protein